MPSRLRSMFVVDFGNRDFSIISSAATRAIRKSGNMFVRTQCEQAWFNIQTNGDIKVK